MKMHIQSMAAALAPLCFVLMSSEVGAGVCEPQWVSTFTGANAIDANVLVMRTFDDGDGPALFAGGFFTMAGGSPAAQIARWNGSSWSSVGGGMDGGAVRTFAVFDDGSGPALYTGGSFEVAGGVLVNHIAKWDGSEWSSVGGGIAGQGQVHTLTVFDDGTGAALYAGGFFDMIGGVAANSIAKWDGSSWSALDDDGIGGVAAPQVDGLRVFDDGTGEALYVSGLFSTAGDVEARGIARWDGSSWSALGAGVTGRDIPTADAMDVFDDGTGAALYVAGSQFETELGDPIYRLARWDGSSWSALGAGFGEFSGGVMALTVFDDGSGPALYAGGSFGQVAGMPVDNMARWDGEQWSALPVTGMGTFTSFVQSLAVFDDGAVPGAASLYVGGLFMSSPTGDDFLTKLQGCPVETVLGDLNGDGLVNAADLALLLGAWGECEAPAECPADLNGDQEVNAADLALLLGAWTS